MGVVVVAGALDPLEDPDWPVVAGGVSLDWTLVAEVLVAPGAPDCRELWEPAPVPADRWPVEIGGELALIKISDTGPKDTLTFVFDLDPTLS